MSDFSLNLVVQKVDKKLNDMAKVLTKFQKITSFGGFAAHNIYKIERILKIKE